MYYTVAWSSTHPRSHAEEEHHDEDEEGEHEDEHAHEDGKLPFQRKDWIEIIFWRVKGLHLSDIGRRSILRLIYMLCPNLFDHQSNRQ